MIDSFTVGVGGRLTAAPGSPFPAQGLGPFGSEFRPASPDQLFVSNAHNTATDSGTVSAFNDHRNGRLSSIAGSSVPGSPDGPVLGGDHPGRPDPVHREHRVGDDLRLPDRR